MKNIFIKNITLIDGTKANILIAKGKFQSITKVDDSNEILNDIPNVKLIDGNGKAIIPAFYNAHTHAAMTLLRSYSEDKILQKWLSDVWKKEATLTETDIYNGTRLAIVEMIRSGSVFFADMYWHHSAIIKAAKDMGVRVNAGITFMDSLDKKTQNTNMEFIKNYIPDDMINISVAPHAVYTCNKNLYKECYKVAENRNFMLQTHLCETEQEVNDCLSKYNLTPVEFLDDVGVLNSNTVAAHCVHLTEKDADILAKRGVKVVHNPCSNMKLASGIFPYSLHKKAGTSIILGTDGCASNNSLSMLEEMKFAALLAKVSTNNPVSLPAEEVFQWATMDSAAVFGLKAGKIEEGFLADCLLINLNHVSLVPNNNLIASLVYSAESECIDSVICNGNLLMENRYMEKEEEIIDILKHKTI
ncbi:MAG: amidohydrolase [Bacteroidales bacterium]|jgi:5-methylthioadenosine/S-adenosylhomocysteine deaminase|nr:amidohydrolase [Bacteroidales bacterium]